MKLNPEKDLIFERTIDITPAQAFRAWTDAELLPHWFCPRPWSVSEAKCDLRPGGLFFTIMNGPNGERFENNGCFLELVQDQKVVWTDLLGGDYEVKDQGLCLCIVTFTPDGQGGTHYKAIARHKNTEDKKKHEEMGFQEGWGIACDQMVALMKSL